LLAWIDRDTRAVEVPAKLSPPAPVERCTSGKPDVRRHCVEAVPNGNFPPLLFPVLLYAWFDRVTGFGLQGREVLPVLMLVPITAAEILYRHRKRLSASRGARPLLGGALGTIAVFQAYAWWSSARVAAGAPHTVTFYAHSVWSPPGRGLPWIMCAVRGTTALLTFLALEARRGRHALSVRTPDARVLSGTHP
jgi:hypothetical protein